MYKAPTSPEEIKQVIRYFNLHANTHIGQHFLYDTTVIDMMIDEYTAEESRPNTVLEVGPGLGILTERLADVAKHVVSVELDTQLEPILHALETQYNNLTIVRNDILRTPLANYGLHSGQFAVVANLPYQITSRFLRNMLTQEPYPQRIIVLVQREVAERIVAQPGQLSVLGVSVQAFAEPEIIAMVPPQAFYPAPAVHSAILAINNIRATQHFPSLADEKLFFQIVKAGFAQKRKMLRNNLKNIHIQGHRLTSDEIDRMFSEIGIKKTVRAQEISLKQWLLMLDKFKTFVI